jgi:hypothetical protein
MVLRIPCDPGRAVLGEHYRPARIHPSTIAPAPVIPGRLAPSLQLRS